MQMKERTARDAVRQASSPAPLGGPLVVTGGGSGLGAAIVAAARRAGLEPLVFDVREGPDSVESYRVDVARREQVERAIADVVRAHGSLGAIVACAGIDACGRLEDVDAEAWERVIAVNLLGTAAVVRAALPHLERSAGRIVTIASTLGIRAVSDATAYCASKFGVVGFTRALAAETAGRVGVTLLIPGGMHTGFFDGRTEQYKPPADARLNQPGDVADAAIFALTRPPGCEVRELVICPATESSWP